MKTNKDIETRLTALEQKVYGKQELYTDKTGKMWSPIAEKTMTWNKAVEYAKDLKAGGYDDWRLPTIDELLTLRKEVEDDGYYWSSTESGTNAYLVYFSTGNVNALNKPNSYYVRCVRGQKAVIN